MQVTRVRQTLASHQQLLQSPERSPLSNYSIGSYSYQHLNCAPTDSPRLFMLMDLQDAASLRLYEKTAFELGIASVSGPTTAAVLQALKHHPVGDHYFVP